MNNITKYFTKRLLIVTLSSFAIVITLLIITGMALNVVYTYDLVFWNWLYDLAPVLTIIWPIGDYFIFAGFISCLGLLFIKRRTLLWGFLGVLGPLGLFIICIVAILLKDKQRVVESGMINEPNFEEKEVIRKPKFLLKKISLYIGYLLIAVILVIPFINIKKLSQVYTKIVVPEKSQDEKDIKFGTQFIGDMNELNAFIDDLTASLKKGDTEHLLTFPEKQLLQEIGESQVRDAFIGTYIPYFKDFVKLSSESSVLAYENDYGNKGYAYYLSFLDSKGISNPFAIYIVRENNRLALSSIIVGATYEDLHNGEHPGQ